MKIENFHFEYIGKGMVGLQNEDDELCSGVQ